MKRLNALPPHSVTTHGGTHMRRRTLPLVATFLAAAALARAASADDDQPRTVYVPGAFAGTDPQIWTAVWAYNNESTVATIRTLTAWDRDGEHDLSQFPPVTIPPRDALDISSSPTPSEGVQFLALSVPPGFVIRPLLHRVSGGDSAGELTLPVFTSLVPAGATSVAGNLRSSHAECAPSGVPRRLNVTLFNAGDEPANFHVVVQTRSIATDDPNLAGRTAADYVVPPRTVRQINGVAYDARALCGDRGLDVGWVEITADQPYLAYASTVRRDAPGVLPYEVFPALTGL
jgi:hypothetical protein